MGEVVYGVDFRQRREAEAKAAFDSAMRALVLLIDEVVHADTAPSEYVAPLDDPA